MTWQRWAGTALGLAAVVAAQARWPEPPVPEQLAFHTLPDDRFAQLRRQAMQFVEARPGLGFQFVDQHPDAAFQIHCRGVPVLWLATRPQHLLLQVSLDAGQRAPAVLQFQAILQWQMEPLGYLEQVLMDAPEPVVMDRVVQWLAGAVPEGAQCGGGDSRAWLGSTVAPAVRAPVRGWSFRASRRGCPARVPVDRGTRTDELRRTALPTPHRSSALPPRPLPTRSPRPSRPCSSRSGPWP